MSASFTCNIDVGRVLRSQGVRSRPDPEGRSVTAYINHGRWVANCPNCNGGVPCFPGHTHDTCTDCGLVYTVVWPQERSEIERVLAVRSRPEHQNWLPHESPAQLVAESVRHGERIPAKRER